MFGQNTTYELSNTDCCPCPDTSLKSQMICQLQTKLHQLNENDKAYNELLQKFRQLQNEYQLMNEAKLRLEYELKQKNESTNKVLNDLKTQNIELNNELNDKNSINKKLFADNNNLFRNLEDRKKENENFNRAVADNQNMISLVSQDKAQCEQDVISLNNTSQKNQDVIQYLSNQLEELKLRNRSQNDELNAKNVEVNNNQKFINDVKLDNANLTNKIKMKNSSLDTVSNQLALANKSIADLQNEINNLGKEHVRSQDQLENLKMNFQKERAIRTQAENDNMRLEGLLKDRDDTVNKLSLINDSLKVNRDQLNASKNKLVDEVNRYKDYIIVLTEQTKKLANELQAIILEDKDLYDLNSQQIARLQQVIYENNKLLADEIAALNALENYCRQPGSPKS